MSNDLVKLEERVRELEALQQSYVVLNKVYHPPGQFIEGMVVYADGNSWDPGKGQGLYQRRGSLWVLLATGSMEITKDVGYLTSDGDAWIWKDEIYAQPSENNTWLKAQYGTYETLTSSSASIAIDLEESNNFKHTLTEDTTLAAPSNAVAGQAGVIEFTQHASEAKTLAFNAFWKWPGGTAGVLTATDSAIDVMSYVVDSSGTFATCVMLGDVS